MVEGRKVVVFAVATDSGWEATAILVTPQEGGGPIQSKLMPADGFGKLSDVPRSQ